MPDNDTGQQANQGGAPATQAVTEDTTTQPQDVPETATDSEVDESTLDDKARAAIDKIRREARNLRQRVKDLEPAARRLKEIEDKDKSESQRLTDKLTELEKQIADYKVREVRTAAAAAAGLPASMAEFITAADPDDAKRQAKALADWGKNNQGSVDLKQGARKPTPASLTGDQLLRRMAGRQ